MHIVIDLQGAQGSSRERGIGRYSIELVKSMASYRKNHQITVVLSYLFPDSILEIRRALNGLLPSSSIRVWSAEPQVAWLDQSNRERRLRAEVIREAFIASLQPDIVLITSMFEGLAEDVVTSVRQFHNIPTAAIVYDLIPLLDPALHLQDARERDWYMEKLTFLKKVDYLLSISNSAAGEAIKHIEWDSSKVTNISTAASSFFKPLNISTNEKKEILEKYNINQNFLFYTGGLEPRKNVPALVSAFSNTLPEIRKNYQLLIVGRSSPDGRSLLTQLAKSKGLNSNSVVVCDYVPDEDLRNLYNLCTAFVYPSLHEGFGLPALEAMQCGKAVIAANNSSLPEVIGRSDSLFNAKDETSITEKINHDRKHLVGEIQELELLQLWRASITASQKKYPILI